MLLTLARQKEPSAVDTLGSNTQPALLHRIYDAIERKLGDPDITPARVAQMEGISERYLQKLFASTRDNFTHYLRERRLQRCWTYLASAAEAHRSVSDIAFGCGFSDAAHFSRSFRDRFGLSPTAFRQQESRRALEPARQSRPTRLAPGCHCAIASPTAGTDITSVEPESSEPEVFPKEASPAHHHLPVDAAHVHWGFFSRGLKPLIEIDRATQSRSRL